MLVGRLAISPFPHMISLNNHFIAVASYQMSVKVVPILFFSAASLQDN